MSCGSSSQRLGRAALLSISVGFLFGVRRGRRSLRRAANTEEIDHASREPSLLWASDREFERVWRAVSDYTESERHFNDMVTRYRALASTWLLAAFAAVGFVLSSESFEVPVARELVVAGIGIAAAIGIMMLWNLDLLVYHQLLEGFFTEARKLELAHPWLPQVRGRQISSIRTANFTARILLFYQAAITVLMVLVVGPSLCIFLSRYGAVAAAAGGAATVALAAALATTIYALTKRASPGWGSSR